MYTVQIMFARSLDLYGGNCVSDFLFRSLGIYLMPKIGKHFKKIVNIIFERT